MTVEDCRTILKVHIQAAEQVGKFASALSLCEAMDAIDAQIAQERAGANSPPPYPPRKPPGRASELLGG